MANETKLTKIVPISFIGATLLQSEIGSTEKLGEIFNEVVTDEEFTQALVNFETILNEIFGKKAGLKDTEYVVVFVPTILPLRDENYLNIIKNFIDKVFGTEPKEKE